MNVKLLRKVAKHILAEPRRLLMRTWILEKSDRVMAIRYGGRSARSTRPFAKCGTAACISGWACIVSGRREEAKESSFMDIGMELLGIDYPQAHRLFGPENWPKKFRPGLKDDGKKSTAKVAAARIEHFIKTEGKE